MKKLKLFEEFVYETSFVVWYEDKQGKHLLATFNNKNKADKYKSEEEGEILNTGGVEKIGLMPKSAWDKLPGTLHLKEGIWAMNKSKIKPFIKDLENAENAKDVKKIQSKYWNLVGDDELMDYLDRAIKAKDISSDDFQDGIADAIGRLEDFIGESNINEKKIEVTKISDILNLQKLVDQGKVTYRGLGMGKLYDDFYDLAGEGGTRIKVNGKEYYITDTDFQELGGIKKIRFGAPFRRG